MHLLSPVLITGASGFIGSRLIPALLSEGVEVRTFGRSVPRDVASTDHVTGDIEDWDACLRGATGCRSVVHLAGRAHSVADRGADDDLYHRTIVKGTDNILAAGAEAGISCFVFFSSVKAIGEGGREPQDEASVEAPSSVYGRCKLEAERRVFSAGARHGFRTTCLRLPLVYGPGQKGNLRRLIRLAAWRLLPPLPRVHNQRSMVYVENVVDATVLVMKHPNTDRKCYIVTDGVEYSMAEIYEWIQRALGRRPSPIRVPVGLFAMLAIGGDLFQRLARRRAPFDGAAFHKLFGSAVFRSDLIRRDLGFAPRTTLSDVIPDLVRDPR